MPYQYKPLEDRVLVKPIPPASETMRGLLLSDTAAKSLEGPPLGTVVSAGPGKYVNGNFCPVGKDIQPGAIISYAGAAGTEVPHNGEPHLLMQEKDILSVVTRA